MTPKEKAEQLIETFRMNVLDYEGCGINDHKAKQCALIAVDEIIFSRKDDTQFDDTLSSTSSEYYTPHPMYLTYWEEVKQEIVEQQNQK